MITFVALLMFLQLGVGWEQSTLLSALLTLPWVLKSFVRAKIRQIGHFVWQLRAMELCMAALLVALAFCFTDRTSTQWLVFLCLFVLCLLCAAHELVARMYYERMLRPRWQRYYNSWKMFISQSTVILTYGVMIMGVGFLEVFYHNRRNAIELSWSMAVYVLAGIYLLLVVYNCFALRSPSFSPRTPRGVETRETLLTAVRAEVHIIDRIIQKPHWLAVVLCLTMLLLPQALMFHTRVLYFIGSRAQGGLAASLQWIGLAQGTVGVIAFSTALALGHWLQSRHNSKHPCRLYLICALMLGLSPLVYYFLTWLQPTTLFPLCVAAFLAQFFFGFGLNCTLPFVRYISGERYRSTINYLYIPLISFVMLIPMAISGWLVAQLGFEHFFLIDSLLALPAWAAAYGGWKITREFNQGSLIHKTIQVYKAHNE